MVDAAEELSDEDRVDIAAAERSACLIGLSEHLIGAMGASGKEDATDKFRPKGIIAS